MARGTVPLFYLKSACGGSPTKRRATRTVSAEKRSCWSGGHSYRSLSLIVRGVSSRSWKSTGIQGESRRNGAISWNVLDVHEGQEGGRPGAARCCPTASPARPPWGGRAPKACVGMTCFSERRGCTLWSRQDQSGNPGVGPQKPYGSSPIAGPERRTIDVGQCLSNSPRDRDCKSRKQFGVLHWPGNRGRTSPPRQQDHWGTTYQARHGIRDYQE